MGDLKARLKPLFRRNSTFSSTKSSTSAFSTSDTLGDGRTWSKSSLRLAKNKKPPFTIPVYEDKEPVPPILPTTPLQLSTRGKLDQTPDTSPETPQSPPSEKQNPIVTLEAPTPTSRGRSGKATPGEDRSSEDSGHLNPADARNTIASQRPGIAHRRQSLADKSQSGFISALLQSESPQFQTLDSELYGEPSQSTNMQRKKIWVKRPGSSATQVTINEEDLVDDVRDMILKKYANSLGRSFDSPDVTLRIIFRHPSGRHSQTERTLGPEEPVSKILEVHYPGGQAVEEALVIDVPQRRTPKHSPHLAMPYYLTDDLRPRETGTDYFPPMPPAGQRSPHLPMNQSVSSAQGSSHHPPAHSMAVLTTGQLPNLPSPGPRLPRHSQHRPKYGRQHTTSPTILQTATAQNLENLKSLVPQPMPTPPILEEATPHKAATPPPPRSSSPRPKTNSKRSKKTSDQAPQAAGSVRDGAVPPINVLIVEDNIINLRLLEAFMKRLKVRWSTAMNGKDAVTRWREGGFHLVLMDIQLPVMNGLDATKEIRRLERVNNIGVFSNSASTTPTFPNGDTIDGIPGGVDSLMNTALFKSPVIIVALTASSLQSDRHEALAAGCNDFLTKPVNFEWLTRKVMEWGCMQALIDFDGWRKWKDFSQAKPAAADKKANGPNGNNKSPKALNGKVQAPVKREKTTLGLGKENGSDHAGTGNDTTDSGSGNEVVVRSA